MIPRPPPFPDTVQSASETPVNSEAERHSVPPASPVVTNWAPGDPVCEALLRGDCAHGITGKTAGVCPFPHPKRCDRFLSWGSGGDKGWHHRKPERRETAAKRW